MANSMTISRCNFGGSNSFPALNLVNESGAGHAVFVAEAKSDIHILAQDNSWGRAAETVNLSLLGFNEISAPPLVTRFNR